MSSATSSVPPLQPVAVLMDELKSDDVATRAEAVSRLHTIACALGPERSRSELIPFLTDSLLEEEDEVLSALALQLNGDFAPLIGGSEYVSLIVPVVEALLGSEEATVRNDMLIGLRTLLPVVPNDMLRGDFFAGLFVRLSANDEWFSRKSCAASLASLLYPRLQQEERAHVRRVFEESLVSDDSPIVRRAAVNAVKAIASGDTLVNEPWEEWMRLLAGLINDQQDSVRLLLVEPIVRVSERVAESRMGHGADAEYEAMVYEATCKLIADRSWRVRYAAAAGYSGLMRAVGKNAGLDGITAFAGLLTDYEAEVRAAAAGQAAPVAEIYEATEVETRLLPVLDRVVLDPSPQVRASLALQLNDLCAVVGQAVSLDRLLPMFLTLFRDDSSQVRLNVISKLDVINRVIGIDTLRHHLVPPIVKLCEDRQWRVRHAILEYLPVVARHLGSDFSDAELLPLALRLLDDPVYGVRQAAIAMLGTIGEAFGPAHFAAVILPRLAVFSGHSNYLRRITFLQLLRHCQALLKAIDPGLWLGSLEGLSRDPIPNVRLNVAKTAKYFPQASSLLDALRKDGDPDVKFYAN